MPSLPRPAHALHAVRRSARRPSWGRFRIRVKSGHKPNRCAVQKGLPFRTPGAAGYVIEKTWCSDSQRRSYFRTPRQTCDEGADPESLGSLGLSWNPLISCAFSSGAAAVTTFYTYPEPTLCTTARKLGWPVATVILDAESNPAHFPSGAAGEP